MIRRERYLAHRPAKKKARVSETVARPTRTSVMYAIAVALVAFYNDKIDHLDKAGKAIALGIALALVNAAWVAVENQLGKAVLRDVPPRSAAVVDDDQRGESALGVALVVLVVLVIVAVLFRLF